MTSVSKQFVGKLASNSIEIFGGKLAYDFSETGLNNYGVVLDSLGHSSGFGVSPLLVLVSDVSVSDHLQASKLVKKLSTLRRQVLLVCYGTNAEQALRAVKSRKFLSQAVTDRFALVEILDIHLSKPVHSVAVFSAPSFDVLWALDEAYGTALLPEYLTSENSRMVVPSRYGAYKLISRAGATFHKVLDAHREIVVPERVGGMGLTWIERGVFSRQPIETVYIPSPVRSVAQGAFYKCTKLKNVVLPNSLAFIGRSSFASCVSLSSIRLPLNLKTISARAFRGCKNLNSVSIPPSVRTIGEEAFAQCPALVLEVEENSFAHRWAKAHGVDFQLIKFPTIRPVASKSSKFEDNQIKYQVLPGGELEVIEIDQQIGINNVRIPANVGGHHVYGIAHNTVVPAVGLNTITLPHTLKWIAPQAIGEENELGKVIGIKTAQVIGERALPAKVSRQKAQTVKPSIDADSVRLSLRMVCHIIDIPVPERFEEEADKVFYLMAASSWATRPQSLFFGNFRDKQSPRIERLLKRGAEMFISSQQLQTSGGLMLPCIVHPAPLKAFEKVCRWVADQFETKIIAVTGSVGKTTAKEFIQLVSSSEKKTVYNFDNQNGFGQIGRYLQQLDRHTEVFIQETGAGRPGLVESGARLLRPDAFVVTNIGMSHIENYGGLQANILDDKISHDRYLSKGGVAFLNYDDPLLKQISLEHEIISYSLENPEAQYTAQNILERNGIISFEIVDKREDVTYEAEIHAFGQHNVLNAILAYAVGKWLEIDGKNIVLALSQYRTTGVRQNLLNLGPYKVFADCYNASYESVLSSLSAMATINTEFGGHKKFVFGDIAELGEHSQQIHEQIGKVFGESKHIEKFYIFGEASLETARTAKALGAEVFYTTERQTLHDEILKDLQAGDVIGFKASHGSALSISIDFLFGTSFSMSDGDLFRDNSESLSMASGDYRLLKGYGAILMKLPKDGNLESLHMPETVEGEKLLAIGPQAGMKSSVQSVLIPDSVQTLGMSAFYLAKELREVKLPRALKYIGRSAFNNCLGLTEILIPEGTTNIGKRAFYNCKSLKKIVIPSSVKVIEEEVFTGCSDVTVYCERGSAVVDSLQRQYPSMHFEFTE